MWFGFIPGFILVSILCLQLFIIHYHTLLKIKIQNQHKPRRKSNHNLYIKMSWSEHTHTYTVNCPRPAGQVLFARWLKNYSTKFDASPTPDFSKRRPQNDLKIIWTCAFVFSKYAKYVVLHQSKLVLQAQNQLRNYHSRGITDLKMPTNLVQLNSQCYGFIDNTKGKKHLTIYIYIYRPNCNKVVIEKSKKLNRK